MGGRGGGFDTDRDWQGLSDGERKSKLACECTQGGPLDTFHILHECGETYLQINKILMDYEQVMKSKRLDKLLHDWRNMSRKQKIDELMCMEGSHLYSSRKDGMELTEWVMGRVAKMVRDTEERLQGTEAP